MPRTMGSAPRIMVNVPNTNAAQQATAASASSVPQRTQPFTAEQLQTAWQGYIDNHPQERALCTTMSYALPQQAGDAEHYVMTVGSPTEQKNVEEHKEALMAYLCDAIKNDRFTLDSEYKRDVGLGRPIKMPINYYKDNDPEKEPVMLWRASATLLFANWLNYYVYQATPFNFV